MPPAEPTPTRLLLASRFTLADLKKLLVLIALLIGAIHCRAQNVEGQIIASQYGQWSLQGTATNNFTFPAALCQITAGGTNFPAFTTGTPVTIVQPGDLAISETLVAGLVNINACSVNLTPTQTHNPPFYLTSGTAGLQEALTANGNAGPNSIIVNLEWYRLGGTVAIIQAAKGNSNLNIVDITTTPYTWYSWNGTSYAAVVGPAMGVGSLNGLQGNLNITGDSTITVTPSAGTIALHANTTTNAIQSINGDTTPAQHFAASGSGLSVNTAGGTTTYTLSGAAGTGTVVAGNPYQMGGYNSSGGTTIAPLPNLYATNAAMSPAQITSLFSSITPGTASVVIPDGTPTASYTYNGVNAKSFRANDDYLQLQGQGIACDAREIYVTLTSGSNQINVGSNMSAADVGKTLSIGYTTGYGYQAPQYTWVPTITAYTYPNATLSSNAPFSSSGSWAWLGTLNTANIQNVMNAVSYGIPISVPSNCKMLTGTLSWNNAQSIVGRQMQFGGFVGLEGQDILQQPETGGATGTGVRLENLDFVVGSSIDASLGYTSYSSTGTPTTVPPLYRPLQQQTQMANNPMGPGWLTNANNGVASVTQNSAVICVPTALGRVPTVGQTIVFPYLPAVFTSTVVSNSGSCSAGFTGSTMQTALPNTSGYTVAQAEYFTGSSVQTITTAIPTSITYPFTVNLANAIQPVPGYESNVASSGHVKIGSTEFDYMGVNGYGSNEIILQRGPATTPGYASGSTVVPLNPCPAANSFGGGADYPWPVIPNINTGNSTPNGASYYPAACGGAAAISFPQTNGLINNGTGLEKAFLENLEFDPTNPNSNGGTIPFNSTIALLQMGNNAGYDVDYGGWAINYLQYGFIQTPAGLGQHGVESRGPTGTGGKIHNFTFRGTTALALVDYGQGSITDSDFYTTLINPYSGTPIGYGTCYSLSSTFDEQTGGLVTNVAGPQVSNVSCEPETHGSGLVYPPYMESDAAGGHWSEGGMEGVFSVIGGTGQTFDTMQISQPWINYGSNNTFTNISGLSGTTAANTWVAGGTINWGSNSSCSAFAGGQGPALPCGPSWVQPVSGQTADTFSSGNLAHPYRSKQDSAITPGEWNNIGLDTTPMTNAFTVDNTEPFYRSYASCTIGGGTQCDITHFDGFTGFITIGPGARVADGPYVAVADFKTATAASQFRFVISAVDQGNGACSAPSSVSISTVPTTTTWTPFTSQPFSFTGYAGCVVKLTFDTGTTNDTLEIGGVTFVPEPGWQLLQVTTPTLGSACSPNGALLGSDTNNIYSCSSGIVKEIAFGAGGAVYPPAGIPQSNGSAWLASLQVGTSGNNLVQLNSSGLLPAINASNLTALTAANIQPGTAPINISGNAATATNATQAAALSAASALPNNTTATTQTAGDNTTKVATDAFVLANTSAPIFTHTLTGSTPTVVVNSATKAALDTEYLTLSANVTAFNLLPSTGIADGEIFTVYIQQPASGSAYTIASGTANSVFTPPTGTTLVNTIPGGCPSIGTVVSSTAPSQLIYSIAYKASLTQYQILGCQTSSPAQAAVNEIAIGGTGNWPFFSGPEVIAQAVAANSGHFTNLTVTNADGGTCTTAPTFNVFDATNTGSSVVGSTTKQSYGTATTQAQTLAINAGDLYGVVMISAGSGCSGGVYSVFATVGQP